MNKYIVLLSVFLLSACAGRYASLNTTMNSCGFGSAPFHKFDICMHDKLAVGPNADRNDYYNKSAADILARIETEEDRLQHKKIKQKEAYNDFSSFVGQKVLEEKKSAQTAALLTAAMVGGVAVVSCAHSAGCRDSFNGGGYDNSHQGCCSWHQGIFVGQCSAGHLVCNDGTVSPSCPC